METATRKKVLPMRISYKQLADMMEICYTTIRLEINSNAALLKNLQEMGWQPYHRLRKKYVIEIFKYMGFPDGYEWYEKENNV